MQDDIRKLLDGPVMPTDFWLYRLEEVLGFEHEASRKAEQLRTVVKYFEDIGIKFPDSLPTPDPAARGFYSIRVSLGKIKVPVSNDAFDALSVEAQRKAKGLHGFCNTIRRLVGQDDLERNPS